jgi:hypothetical protein
MGTLNFTPTPAPLARDDQKFISIELNNGVYEPTQYRHKDQVVLQAVVDHFGNIIPSMKMEANLREHHVAGIIQVTRLIDGGCVIRVLRTLSLSSQKAEVELTSTYYWKTWHGQVVPGSLIPTILNLVKDAESSFPKERYIHETRSLKPVEFLVSEAQ